MNKITKADKAKLDKKVRAAQRAVKKLEKELRTELGMPIEVVAEGSVTYVKGSGRKRKSSVDGEDGKKILINAGKHLMEQVFTEMGSVEETGGYTVKNWETLTLVFGPTTEGEKTLYAVLDMFADLIMGRPLIEEIDFADLEGAFELGDITDQDVKEVLDQFHVKYDRKFVPDPNAVRQLRNEPVIINQGHVRYAGMKEGYDAKALFEAARKDPTKYRLLKATSGKRIHIVLFGKLHSFINKKAAAAA